MDREKILKDAVREFGVYSQMFMCVEKMSELTKAICKYHRAHGNDEIHASIDNMREEMADVQIMLNQMKIMFGDVEDIERTKLERLEKRMESAKGELM